MQSLEVISINIWNILISLCNLAILFWAMKKFLYAPVRNMIAKRQAELDAQYAAAAEAEKSAAADRDLYAEKLKGAKNEADGILRKAAADADRNGSRIVAEARDKAEGIVRQAQNEAELEKKKAEAEIRRQIADVSTALTEQMLRREIRTEDHQELIDSFLQEMGDAQ